MCPVCRFRTSTGLLNRIRLLAAPVHLYHLQKLEPEYLCLSAVHEPAAQLVLKHVSLLNEPLRSLFLHQGPLEAELLVVLVRQLLFQRLLGLLNEGALGLGPAEGGVIS